MNTPRPFSFSINKCCVYFPHSHHSNRKYVVMEKSLLQVCAKKRVLILHTMALNILYTYRWWRFLVGTIQFPLPVVPADTNPKTHLCLAPIAQVKPAIT